MADPEAVPTLTVDQMREVDRLMLEEFQIGLLQMMENAGRALALEARRLLGGDVRGSRVIVPAGRGGNGGGGLTAARRLSIWGADVSVVLGASRSEFEGVPRHQLDIVERLPVLVREAPFDEMEDALRSADLILDALIGYSLRGAPREPIASVIRAANASRTPLLALDIPSGLNADTGEVCDPTIRAVATLTLALPKAGLTRRAAAAWVGDLYLADISVPDAVYARLGVSVGPMFSRSEIIAVRPGWR
ncbi:MAG: NAD(P)H-hydrate epimerase [Chloroflexi bacterium]|nr:NAD(P)H-hydrate epimerase [Chloroflexota bacterium]